MYDLMLFDKYFIGPTLIKDSKYFKESITKYVSSILEITSDISIGLLLDKILDKYSIIKAYKRGDNIEEINLTSGYIRLKETRENELKDVIIKDREYRILENKRSFLYNINLLEYCLTVLPKL